MNERIDQSLPESSWEKVNRVMEDTATIEKLAALYREGGRTAKQSLEMAIEAYQRSHRTP